MSTSNHVDPAAARLMRDFAGPATFAELDTWHDHPVFMLSSPAVELALERTGCPDEYITREMVAAVRRALVPLIKSKGTK